MSVRHRELIRGGGGLQIKNFTAQVCFYLTRSIYLKEGVITLFTVGRFSVSIQRHSSSCKALTLHGECERR